MSVSQNRKCVCNSQNTIQNVSVRHKIKNVYVSHKIRNSHTQSISEGAGRGVLAMVCDGPYWFPVYYM